MNTKKRASQWISLLFLYGATFVFAKVQGGFTSWFLFYSLTVIVLYAVIVSFFTLNRLSLQREIEQTRMFAGDTLEVRLTITHRSFFPLAWLAIEDELSEPLEQRAEHHKTILYPGCKRTITYTYRIPYLPRGSYRIHKLKVSTGDFFGLVYKEKEVEHLISFVVYPRPIPVTGWVSLNDRNTGNSYVVNRSLEDVTSVVGVRDYVYGDRLHRIHWKSTARTQTLKTKEFETRVTNDFMFFLDARETSYKGRYSPLFERAVQLTASLMKHAADRRFAMGMLCLDSVLTRLRMSRSVDQLILGYEHLTHATANGKAIFSRTLMKEASYLPVGTTIVAITPELSDELIQTIHHLIHRKVKVELFWVLEPREWTAEEKNRLEKLEIMGCPYYTVLFPPYEFKSKGGTGYVPA
jgi:uncharacterized protein (DUF58 family)